MQQVANQGRAGTREAPLVAPLCVLLAQLQQVTSDAAGKRDVLGLNPLMVLQLAYQMSLGRSAVANKQRVQQLLNPDPALLHELLLAKLTRRVVLAAVDSEERLLQEWQRQQQCWLLTTIAARLLNYADPESAGLASVFCLLESDVAQVLPVPQLWRDLKATLQLPHAELRDTALLSRLVWCCHRLQRNQLRLDETLLSACNDLLGWQEPRLRGLAEEAQVALLQRSKAIGVSTGLELLQRDSLSGEHWLQEMKLQGLRQLTQANYSQLLQPPSLNTAAELQLQIQRLLLRHQMPLQFLLLAAPAQSDKLEVVLGADGDELQQQFAIPLSGGRSMLGSLVTQNTVARLRLNDVGLAPVDKQLLRLLESESVLCLPLGGGRPGALLLPDAAPDNPELASLARNVQQLLASYRQHGQTSDQGSEVALLQQQVRELVHEVNNPLAIIKNYLQVLKLKYPAESSAKEEISHIDSEIDRITRMLQTTRNNVTASNEKVELDLNELVRSHHKWLVAAFGGREGLKLSFAMAAEPAIVFASPASLAQILLNLVKNAAEALGESGKINLAIKRNVHLLGRLHVMLEVSDDGPGLESWQMQKLFQAGSSTKSGPHTGSGLVIVKKLVDELQGQISCHSDKNGTTFSLLFPQVR